MSAEREPSGYELSGMTHAGYEAYLDALSWAPRLGITAEQRPAAARKIEAEYRKRFPRAQMIARDAEFRERVAQRVADRWHPAGR